MIATPTGEIVGKFLTGIALNTIGAGFYRCMYKAAKPDSYDIITPEERSNKKKLAKLYTSILVCSCILSGTTLMIDAINGIIGLGV